MKWFDYNKVISRNALFNFCIAERGCGKSYGITKLVIDRFLKKGEQFIYLRRYKSELKSAVGKFFDAIIDNHEYPEDEVLLQVKNNKFYINGEVAGYAVALSTANILKSSSFPKVATIIYDEFLIDKGAYHYLPNEVNQTLDLYETVSRLRDVKMFFIGNAISVTNPFFTKLGLSLPYGSDIKMFKNNTICVYYASNYEYRAKKKATRFGQMISDLDYGKYAIDNEWLRDSKAFIKKKGKGCHYYFTLFVAGHSYGVWVNWSTDELFISKNVDPNCPMTFAIAKEDHNDNTILARTRRSPYFKNICECYRNGLLMFESIAIKNEVLALLNRMLTY